MDHHGSHHSSSSRSHADEEHERRGRDYEHKDRDHYRRDECRQDQISSRLSSPSPPRSRVGSFSSSDCSKLKKEGDVIENMENSFTDGPLETLKRCVHDGQKVMVWIRNHKGIRGICTGFVLAFDKFWNLVMQDVDEVYQKSRYPKTPFLQPVNQSRHLPEAKSLKKKKQSVEKAKDKVVKMDIEISESARQEARERKKKRKEEEKKKRAQERSAVCKRNVKKLFVRGDNVVLVRVCD